MYTGDARFWKAIDASYDLSEVEKVQTHLGDQDPTGFELRRGKVEMEFNSDGEIVDLHPRQ